MQEPGGGDIDRGGDINGGGNIDGGGDIYGGGDIKVGVANIWLNCRTSQSTSG